MDTIFKAYWNWATESNPLRGFVVTFIVFVVLRALHEWAEEASKAPVIGSYKTGDKEIAEDYATGRTVIRDEREVVYGSAKAKHYLTGCLSAILSLLVMVFAFLTLAVAIAGILNSA